MRISDWSSDVCSSDLKVRVRAIARDHQPGGRGRQVLHGRCKQVRRFVPFDATDKGQVNRPCGINPWQAGRSRYAPLIMTVRDNQPRLVRKCWIRSEEHTSELQSLMRISYAVFCLNKNIKT